jgi:hypothetical protein
MKVGYILKKLFLMIYNSVKKDSSNKYQIELFTQA